MSKKKRLILLSTLIVSIIFVGCSNTKVSEVDALKQEINDLKSEILMISNSLHEEVNSSTDTEMLETQINDLKGEVSKLTEAITLNNYHEDLTDLSTYESLKFEEFRKNYKDEILIGIQPISICKMYLFAELIGDYETQYELYTTNKEYVAITKDEFLNVPIEHRMSNFMIFEDVYNLKIDIRTNNEEHATITWNTKNGYVDEQQGAFIYSFSLLKDEDVWKVSFVPMQ